MEAWIKIRNKIIGWGYRWVLRPILFRFDPELAHEWFVEIGRWLGSTSTTRWLTKIWFYYEQPILAQEILGIKFKNPIGLAAGFDKNAEMIGVMPVVGFGFTEIGSVTGRPCAGNPKPRLWRLPKSRSLIVYYGLKNDGAVEIASRLKKAREVGLSYTKYDFSRPEASEVQLQVSPKLDFGYHFPVGVSIAKTNDDRTVTTEDGIADYLLTYQAFVKAGVGDYYAINISCPNTFGGEPFVEPAKLDKLLSTLRGETSQWPKPVFLKLPPDLSHKQIDQIIELARKYKINGFICSNLTKDRSISSFQDKIKEKLPTDVGGLSGKIVEELANEQIKYIYQKIRREFVIIGCGGVFTAKDAYLKIKAGASLIQLITGLIFEGPQVISEINQGLANLLKRDGYKNINEAIGKGT